jgi:hypothetical protein
MNIHLDITHCLSDQIGTSRGVTRNELASYGGAFARILDPMSQAAAEGLLPHLRSGPSWEEQRGLLSGLLETDSFTVLGAPEVIRAICAICPALSGFCISGPDGALIHDRLSHRDLDTLIVLDGPPWLRHLGTLLQPQFKKTLILSGDGGEDDGWLLPDSVRILSPGVSDPRFAPFSPFVAAVLEAQGSERDSYLAPLEAMRDRLLQPSIWRNPAHLLASFFIHADKNQALLDLGLLHGQQALEVWAQWAAMVWSGLSTQTRHEAGRRLRKGSTAYACSLASELGLQHRINSTQVLTLSLTAARSDEVPIESLKSIWSMESGLLDSLKSIHLGKGCPLATIELPSLDPGHLLALSAFWTHAALVVGAHRGDDPLAMAAADQWREILSRQLDLSRQMH